jgi:hypothetical protein
VEEKRARKWYWWLWLSPLLTLPTLAVTGFLTYQVLDEAFGWGQRNTAGLERTALLLGLLLSSAWHLILLVPALRGKSEYVRWHGRQALLLAALRTIVPLAFVLAFGFRGEWELLAIPILIAIWLVGSTWGYVQASRGKCTLMRWSGLADAQPFQVRAREAAQRAAQETGAEAEADALVEVIRYSHDPEDRRKALARLTELGLVESL